MNKLPLGSTHIVDTKDYEVHTIDEIINYTSYCESADELENVRLPLFNEGFEPYDVIRTYNGDGTANISILCDVSNENNLPTQIWFGNNVSDSVSSQNYEDIISINELKYTYKLINANGMFKRCVNLEYINTVNFKTNNIKDMNSMFFNCCSLTSLDVSNWDTSNVTTMSSMFYNCKSLTSLEVNNFNTSNVTDMALMFRYCESLTLLDVSKWNTSNVTTMYAMFWGCDKLISITGLSNWDTSNVTNMSWLFTWCRNLISLDLSTFNTSNVTTMDMMFFSCLSLTSLDVSNWNTNKVTSMQAMFCNCRKLTSLNISNFDTSNVINTIYTEKNSKYGLFQGNSILMNIVFGENCTFTKTTTMQNMFYDCSSLTSLDVSNFDTSNVTDMRAMFWNCNKLISLDVSNFDTNNVTDMFDMFSECHSLTLIDVSNFKTSNVITMGHMFYNCRSLASIDVSNFNINNVTNISNMFNGCRSLTSLDTSNWDTSNVTSMRSMFYQCRLLTSLDVSNWNTGNVTSMRYMFRDCYNLKTIKGINNFIFNDNVSIFSLFEDCSNIQYFNLSKWNVSKLNNFDYLFINDNSSIPSKLKTLDISNWQLNSSVVITEPFRNNNELQYIKCNNATTIKQLAPFLPNRQEKTAGKIIMPDNYNSYDYGSLYLNEKNWAPVTLSEGTLIARYKFDSEICEDFMPEFNEGFGGAFAYDTIEDIENAPNIITRELYCFGDLPTKMIFGYYKNSNGEGINSKLDVLSLLSIDYINVSSLISYGTMFSHCHNLTSIDANNWNTNNVTSMAYMFLECYSLTLLDVSNWNTSNVTDMRSMFSDCQSLISLDVSNFNTSNASTMRSMFNGCESLTSIDVSNFDTSNVKDMYCMFSNCNSLTSLDVSNFNTNNVINMAAMFSKCYNLTSLDVSNWNVSNVTDMGDIFNFCYLLKNVDVSNWDTSNVQFVNGMFGRCRQMTMIDISNFDMSVINTSDATKYFHMFIDIPNVKTLIFGNNKFLDNVDFIELFGLNRENIYLSSLEKVIVLEENIVNKLADILPDRSAALNPGIIVTNVELSDEITNIISSKNWSLRKMVAQYRFDANTYEDLMPEFNSEFTEDMYEVHDSVSEIVIDDIQWELGYFGGDGIDYDSTIQHRSSYIPILSNVTYNVKLNGVNVAFYDANKQFISYIGYDSKNNPFSSFVTPIKAKYIKIYQHYTHDAILTAKLITRNIESVNGDLPTSMIFGNSQYSGENLTNDRTLSLLKVYSINTLELSTMYLMFHRCERLRSIKNLVPTNKLTNLNGAFSGCLNLSDIDVSNWDVSNVTNMKAAFKGCQMAEFNASNWNTSKVTSMDHMFYSCTELCEINITSWDTFNVTDMSYMFFDCNKLCSILGKVKTDNVTNMKGMFQNCKSFIMLGSSSWNTSKVTNMSYMYAGCTNLKTIDVSNRDVGKVTNMAYMFYNCQSLTSLDVFNWNTSKVTDMTYMFGDCHKLTALDVSNWNVSSVTNMSSMFNKCTLLTSLDVSKWNTGNVENISNLFFFCSSLTSLDVSNWDTSKVTNMNNSFNNCHALTTIGDVSNWNISNVNSMDVMFHNSLALTSIQGLNNWNTSNVQKMRGMFSLCKSLKRLDLSGWKVTNIVYDQENVYGLFDTCHALTTLDLNNTIFENITDFRKMFSDATQLKYIRCNSIDNLAILAENLLIRTQVNGGIILYEGNLADIPAETINALAAKYWTVTDQTVEIAVYKFDKDIYNNLIPKFNSEFVDYFIDDVIEDEVNAPNIVTRTIKSMGGSPTSISLGGEHLGNNVFTTYQNCLLSIDYLKIDSNITTLQGLCYHCGNLTYINTEGWDTSNVTDMRTMFEDCYKLTSLDLSNFNTSNVTTMGYMFGGCHKLTSLDVSNFSTSLVTDMDHMFSNCNSLTSLDVSDFNTSSVTDMSNMFVGCHKLTSLDVSNWSTGKVRNMAYMFGYCQALQSIDVSKWNTSSLDSMSAMFYDCRSLTSLNVSNWDTSNVTNMNSTFSQCASLVSIDGLNNWITNNVTDMYCMFNGCWNLNSLDVSNFNTSKVTNTSAMFGCADGLTSALTNLNCSNFNLSKSTSVYRMFKNLSSLKVLDLTNVEFTATDYNEILLNTNNLEILKCNKLSTIQKLIPLLPDRTDREEGCLLTIISEDDLTVALISQLENKNWSIVSEVGTKIAEYIYDPAIYNNAVPMFNEGYMNNCIIVDENIEDYNGENGRNVIRRCIYNVNNEAPSKIQFAKVDYIDNLYIDNCASSYLKISYLDTSLLEGENWAGIFRYCRNVTYINAENWDTSRATSFHSLFAFCNHLLELDLNHFDTSNVVNYQSTFHSCWTLTSLKVDTWDTSNGDRFPFTFLGCSKLTELDLSNWDTSKSNTFQHMFSGCYKLTTLKLNNFDTNKILILAGMFDNCRELTLLDISNWNVNSVTNFSDIFNSTPELQYIKCDGADVVNALAEYLPNRIGKYEGTIIVEDSTGIDTAALSDRNWSIMLLDNCVTIAEYKYDKATCNNMVPVFNSSFTSDKYFIIDTYENTEDVVFGNNEKTMLAENIVRRKLISTELLPTSIHFGERYWNKNSNKRADSLFEIIYVNITNLTDFNSMFRWCRYVRKINASNWNFPACSVRGMFTECYFLKEIITTGWNTSKVTDMSFMFHACYALTSLDVSNFDTGNVINMEHLFHNCERVTSLNVSNWNTSNVTDMFCMFQDCRKLTDLDVSNWNTSKVTTMGAMFKDCENITSLAVSNWDTAEVTDMSAMFDYCTKLTQLDVSKWRTLNVRYMNSMFNKCHILTSLDVSNWDTSEVTNINNMFYQCHALTEINVSNWNTSNVESIALAFAECYALTEIDVSNWDISKVKYMSCTFFNCKSLQALDVSNWDTSKVEKMNGLFGAHNKVTQLKTLNLNNLNAKKNIAIHPDDTRFLTNTIYSIEKIFFNDLYTLETLLEYLDDRTGKEAGLLITSIRNQINAETLAVLAAKNWVVRDLIAQYQFNAKKYEDLVPEFNAEFTADKYEIYDHVSEITIGNNIKWSVGDIHNGSGIDTAEGEYRDARRSDFLYINPTFIYYQSMTLTDPFLYWKIICYDKNKKFIGYQLITEETFSIINKETKYIRLVINERYLEEFQMTAKLVNRCIYNTATNESPTLIKFGQYGPNNEGVSNRTLSLLKVNDLNTTELTDMFCMFDCCKNLLSINTKNWNTSKVTTMYRTFGQCRSLQSLDVSHFDTSNVTDICGIFHYCVSLTSLDVSKWDTSNVTIMQSVFNNIRSLSTLDLSNWDTSKVTNMTWMFFNCGTLTSLDLSSFDISAACSIDNMFIDFVTLTNLNAPRNISVNLNLSSNINLTVDSLIDVIENLATVTEPKTLKLGQTNLNKLSAIYISKATQKGWTVTA